MLEEFQRRLHLYSTRWGDEDDEYYDVLVIIVIVCMQVTGLSPDTAYTVVMETSLGLGISHQVWTSYLTHLNKCVVYLPFMVNCMR